MFIAWIKKHLLLIGILILAFLPFVVNVNDFFVSDDWEFARVYANPSASIIELFRTNTLGETVGGSYRPIASFLWFVSVKTWQTNPLPLHLLNILLHVFNTFLVYQLTRRFFRNHDRKEFIGLVAALLFAILPNHAEPVIWVSAPDVLVTTFFLLSLVFIDTSLKNVGQKRRVLFCTSLICAMAALFTKEMALSVFPIVFFWVYSTQTATSVYARIKRSVFISLPYGFITCIYLYARYRATGLLFGYYGPKGAFSLRDIASTQIEIFLSHLVSDARFLAAQRLFLTHVRATVIVTTGMCLALFLFAYRKRWLIRWHFLILCLMYLVSTLPVLKFSFSFIPFYFSNEGQRFAYLPSVFFCLLLGWLFSLIRPSWSRTLLLGGTCVLLFLQLLPQTYRWHKASLVARRSVAEVAQLLRDHAYDGVIFLGVPDQYHGALIFRNGFIHALERVRSDRAVLLGVFNRILVDGKTNFSVDSKDSRTILYRAHASQSLIAAPSSLSSPDLQSRLSHPVYVKRANHHFFGEELLLTLAPSFVEKNKIGIVYFDGLHWQASD